MFDLDAHASKKQQNSDRSKYLILLAVLFGLLTIKLGLYYWETEPDSRIQFVSAFKYILESLIQSLVVIIILAYAIQKGENTRISKAVSSTISAVLAGKVDLLENRTQDKIIQESIKFRVDDYFGGILYDEFVKPFITEDRHYRDNVDYSVELKEIESIPQKKYSFQESKSFIESFNEEVKALYYWAEQKFEYSRHAYTANREAKFLVVQIFLSDEDLNRAFSNDELFMREVLSIGEREKKLLLATKDNDDALEEIFLSLFNFSAVSLEDGNRKLELGVRWGNPKQYGTDFIEVNIENEFGKVNGSGCQLNFRLPILKDITKFVMVSPVSTRAGAVFKFKRADNQKRLTMTPFFSQLSANCYKEFFDLDDSGDVSRITVRTKEWVFPISGIVFHWR